MRLRATALFPAAWMKAAFALIILPLRFEAEGHKVRIEPHPALKGGASHGAESFSRDLKPLKKARGAKRLLGLAAVLLAGRRERGVTAGKTAAAKKVQF